MQTTIFWKCQIYIITRLQSLGIQFYFATNFAYYYTHFYNFTKLLRKTFNFKILSVPYFKPTKVQNIAASLSRK